MHPPLHFTSSPYCPQFCLPHPSPLQPCISLWLLGSGDTPPAKTGDRRWDLGPLSPGRDMSHPYLASGHSLTRYQVQGCVPEDPALCTWHCHSRYGQQGAGLAATLLIAFPGLSWPQDSRGMSLTLIP